MKIMLGILIGIILLGFFLLEYHPVFGGKPTAEKRHTLSQSPNFSYNKFINQIPTPMDMDVKNLIITL
ncbi:MAG: hypothetical protein K0R55_664, partial [Sporomusa sp.]|nr:hypothetical protein [Sporomusa sp.]